MTDIELAIELARTFPNSKIFDSPTLLAVDQKLAPNNPLIDKIEKKVKRPVYYLMDTHGHVNLLFAKGITVKKEPKEWPYVKDFLDSQGIVAAR